MKKNHFFIFLLFCSFNMFSQVFLEGSFTFSSKKDSYLTLSDGKEIVGKIDDIDRKKGLIEKITIKDENGKKTEYLASNVKHMYIAPSGFDKFASGYSNFYDATKWNTDQSINAEHIKTGYVLFEMSEVMIKKEKKTLLLQLLNPGFASKIRVYFDPHASETASMGIGGFKVAGGDAKSYYVKKGDEVAIKLEKKNYEEEEFHLYGDCLDFKSKFEKKKLNWTDFAKHIFVYTTECNNK